jgi:hypothetical protein
MLQVDIKRRPTCQQLIESNLFEYYSIKLCKLDIVDANFKATVESHRSGMPSQNRLLQTIYIPNDIKQLSGFLPRRNYENHRKKSDLVGT